MLMERLRDLDNGDLVKILVPAIPNPSAVANIYWVIEVRPLERGIIFDYNIIIGPTLARKGVSCAATVYGKDQRPKKFVLSVDRHFYPPNLDTSENNF